MSTCNHPRQPVPWAPYNSMICAWPECSAGGAGEFLSMAEMPNSVSWYDSKLDGLSKVRFMEHRFKREILANDEQWGRQRVYFWNRVSSSK